MCAYSACLRTLLRDLLMAVDYLIGGSVIIILLAYLLYVLVNAQKF